YSGERAADLFPSAASLARSDLEIFADLLGRNRVGIARQLSSRRVHVEPWSWIDSIAARRTGSKRPPLPRPATEGGVFVSPSRLRHKNGPRAASHLVARCAQRIAFDDFGTAFGRAAELCVPSNSSRLASLHCGRTSGVLPGTFRLVRSNIDGGCGSLHSRSVRLQTDAGLLKR